MNYYRIVQIVTSILLLLLSYQKYLLNLNLFTFLLYILSLSFLNFKSIDQRNIMHISWMALCSSFSLYFNNYLYQIFFVAIVPLSYLYQSQLEQKQEIFRWIQWSSVSLFLISICFFYIDAIRAAYITAIISVFIRQGQFPFYVWFREIKINREMFPSILFYIISQTGFIIYAETVLHTYSEDNYYLVPLLTLTTGLVLSVYALKEKDVLTKHILLIMSQGCLPLASYHSFSSTSATGGLLFAMTLALSGLIYGLFAFHFFKQKNIKEIDKNYSLYRSNKNIAVIYFVCGFSLVGLPFTIGYFAEDILFHGLIETATSIAPLYIVMAAINGYTVFHIFNRIFFGHTQKKWTEIYLKSHTRSLVGFATLVLTLGIFYIGNFANSIERRIEQEHINLLSIRK